MQFMNTKRNLLFLCDIDVICVSAFCPRNLHFWSNLWQISHFTTRFIDVIRGFYTIYERNSRFFTWFMDIIHILSTKFAFFDRFIDVVCVFIGFMNVIRFFYTILGRISQFMNVIHIFMQFMDVICVFWAIHERNSCFLCNSWAQNAICYLYAIYRCNLHFSFLPPKLVFLGDLWT